MRVALFLTTFCLAFAGRAAADCVIDLDRGQVEVVRGELRVDLSREIRRQCRGVNPRDVRLDRVTVVIDGGRNDRDRDRDRYRDEREDYRDRYRDRDRDRRGDTVEIYRFYSGRQHMVSADPDEGLGRGFGRREGVSFELFRAQGPNRRPVYRCVVPERSDFFLSLRSDCEGRSGEGLLGYVLENETPFASKALYRCFNKKLNDHLATTSKNECGANGYVIEVVLGYVP